MRRDQSETTLEKRPRVSAQHLFDALPDEMVISVLRQLPVKTIPIAALISRRMAQLCRENQLWKDLTKRDFRHIFDVYLLIQSLTGKQTDYRLQYRKHYNPEIRPPSMSFMSLVPDSMVTPHDEQLPLGSDTLMLPHSP